MSFNHLNCSTLPWISHVLISEGTRLIVRSAFTGCASTYTTPHHDSAIAFFPVILSPISSSLRAWSPHSWFTHGQSIGSKLAVCHAWSYQPKCAILLSYHHTKRILSIFFAVGALALLLWDHRTLLTSVGRFCSNCWCPLPVLTLEDEVCWPILPRLHRFFIQLLLVSASYFGWARSYKFLPFS